MRAVEITNPGEPDVLRLAERPLPAVGRNEVLIRVIAAGVNRPDVLQRRGLYPAPPGHSDLPGLEVAGEIVAVGEAVSRWSRGARVVALTNGGGYAEYCAVDAGAVLPMPAGLSALEAALLPETVFTVWHNVFERGALQPGGWLLVHGGSSGIGTTAIQMAVGLGAKVIATAGSAEKCAACTRLGAVRAVNYREEDFVAVVKELTGQGVDVVLDMVGGDYVARNIRATANDGRIVQIAFLEGSKVTIDLMPVMLKRLTLTGSTLRARTAEVKAGIAHMVERRVWPMVAEGRLTPLVDSQFALADAAKAHARMEGGAHIGKIGLVVANDAG
ncbi:MAG: zinc-binding dehydrogenase [Rhizobiales bacterium]|nr:zinc-binding dehydrogenase [Hyphomicrobiales bacterium]